MSQLIKKIDLTQKRKKMRAFYQERRKYLKPEMVVITLTAIIAVFIFICFSVYLHPEGSRFSFHFYLEEGAVTILSVANLFTASLLAYACFFMKPIVAKRQRVFFLLVAVAITYLALDEFMHFHEHVGDYIDTYRFMRVIAHRLNVRRWNDMLIIIYGLVALPVLIHFMPTALKIPHVAEYFIVAFICYAAHTAIDSFVEPPTTPSYIIEESLKLYTSTFLALGLLSGLLFLIDAKKKGAKKQTKA